MGSCSPLPFLGEGPGVRALYHLMHSRKKFMQETSSSKITPVRLLAAAAIIGLVIAITYPILTNGRKVLHQGNCLTNLQQIGKATQMYRRDNDEVQRAARENCDQLKFKNRAFDD